jgi:hypothetical protein
VARLLSENDIRLLKKMVPELENDVCTVSQNPFRSILPPVAVHFSSSAVEFRDRLSRLSEDELEYLTDLILSGEESVHCLPPDYLFELIGLVAERLDKRRSDGIYFVYEAGGACNR